MKKLFVSIGFAMLIFISLFSTVISKADIISADSQNSIEIETSDKYGIKSLCRKFGFDVDAPEYLPKGAAHTEIKYVNDENPSISLFFRCKETVKTSYPEKHFQIVYTYFDESTSLEEYVLEFNDWELEEPILVNGTEGYIVSAFNTEFDEYLYFIVYYRKNVLMRIFLANIGYEEAYQILKSIK